MLVTVRHCDNCPAFHDGKEVCLITGIDAGQTRGIPMRCPLRRGSVTLQLNTVGESMAATAAEEAPDDWMEPGP